MTPPLLRRALAELVATFTLVFAGTGAIVIDDVSGGAITHLGVAAVFGLVVMAMIHAVGDVSGAHMNPAVTLAFWVSRRLEGRMVAPYVVAQAAGAILASLVLHALFVGHPTLGLTAPSGGAAQSFGLELLLSAILMFVIFGVATGPKERGIMAGTAVGGTVGLEALFAGPICGASMNPARSLGPAIVSGRLDDLWIYLVAPIVGMLAACALAPLLRPQARLEPAAQSPAS